jgi:hypothetical protein
MPLVAFIAITVIVLGISIVGMYTRESDPSFGGEEGYNAFAESAPHSQTEESSPPVARRA